MTLNLLYFVVKVTALIAATVYNFQAKADVTLSVISALVLCCLFVIGFVAEKIKYSHKINLICALFSILICFYNGTESYFPVALFIIINLLEWYADGVSFWQISGIVFMLGFMTFIPNLYSSLITLSLITVFIVARIAILKLNYYYDIYEQQKKELIENKYKLTDIKNYIKTVKQTTSLEERNRFSARIHDQLGHGISGSVILLEAAKANMKTNPKKSEELIEMVAENLRSSVDEIRKSLHDERPDRSRLGISEIDSILKQFSISYSIKSDLKVLGDCESIQVQVWVCIHENLKEALTNTLKHSSANKFFMTIQVYNKVVRVEYKDNGACSGAIKKGLGLEAIEERTALCGGKTLFRQGQNGFSITNIFMI